MYTQACGVFCCSVDQCRYCFMRCGDTDSGNYALLVGVGAMVVGCSLCCLGYDDGLLALLLGLMVVGCSHCCWGYDDGLLALLLGLWWRAALIVVGAMVAGSHSCLEIVGYSSCCWG